MKKTKENKIVQLKAEKTEIEQFVKKLSKMTNRDSLFYLKKNYYSLYSQLEDELIRAVMTLPDITYLSDDN